MQLPNCRETGLGLRDCQQGAGGVGRPGGRRKQHGHKTKERLIFQHLTFVNSTPGTFRCTTRPLPNGDNFDSAFSVCLLLIQFLLLLP